MDIIKELVSDTTEYRDRVRQGRKFLQDMDEGEGDRFCIELWILRRENPVLWLFPDFVKGLKVLDPNHPPGEI